MKLLPNKYSISSVRNLLILLAYTLYALALIQLLVTQFFDKVPKESWEITEWLINYQGGFIRRGLTGEIILKLYDYLGFSPYIIILYSSLAAYIAIIVYFIYVFTKKGYSLFLLPFVFFLGNPVINYSWIRKDLLLLILFILILHFLVKKKPLSFIIANLILVIALLIHEAIGFFCLPVMFLLLISKRTDNLSLFNSIGLSTLKLSPSIITFLLVLYYKGSVTASSAIWQSWKSVSFPYQDKSFIGLPGAIDGISWPLQKNIGMLKSTLTESYNGIYAPLVWVLVLFLIYLILLNINKFRTSFRPNKASTDFNIIHLSNILIFQFLTIIPLFILGCDFGRWIFFWVTSSFAIYLIVPEERLSILFPPLLTKIGLRFYKISETTLSRSFGFIYILPFFIGFPAITSGPTWQIGIDAFYNSSAIIVTVKFISSVVLKCQHLF